MARVITTASSYAVWYKGSTGSVTVLLLSSSRENGRRLQRCILLELRRSVVRCYAVNSWYVHVVSLGEREQRLRNLTRG